MMFQEKRCSTFRTKNNQKISNNRSARHLEMIGVERNFGGGEGSRTPVHKASKKRHYERSRCLGVQNKSPATNTCFVSHEVSNVDHGSPTNQVRKYHRG